MRQAIERARGATAGERGTLLAVIDLLALYQRLEDRVSLGQVAVHEGAWDGDARACPESRRNAIGRRLKRLHELGALEYEPARYEGDRARIRLPRAGEISTESQPDEVGSRRARANSNVAESQPERRREPTREAPRANPRRLGTEGSSEDVVRGKEPEDARARNDAGSPAAGPEAGAATDEPDDGPVTAYLWKRYADDEWTDTIDVGAHLDRYLPGPVAELLLDRLETDPPKTVRLVLRTARALADELDLDLPRLDLPHLKAVR